MKITELLTKLDDTYEADSVHSIVLYGDGSGRIEDCNKEEIFDWDNRKEMNKKLTQLWRDLNETNETWEI